MTAPDQTFYDFEFTHSNRGIHTYVMLIVFAWALLPLTCVACFGTSEPQMWFRHCWT